LVDAFADAVASWTNFYMLAGSAAATLIGLIFVAVSLHIDVIAAARIDSDLRTLAGHTFSNFLLILSFAFTFMVPADTPLGIGGPMLVLGLWQLFRTAKLWIRFRPAVGNDGRVFSFSQLGWNLLIPNSICYMTVVFLAVQILQGQTGSMGWMVLVVIWLMISATKSAWELMLRVAEIKKEGLGK